jgi:D-alanyl-D-alanine endopeptidase (penicillin-binding protein 7)
MLYIHQGFVLKRGGILLGLLLICLGISAKAGNHSQAITAKSWIVADAQGTVLTSDNINQQRSVASITKLLTVMVVLDARQDLGKKIQSHTRQQLIDLTLIRSNNSASEKLCQNYPGGRSRCIRAMNDKAIELGMYQSRFVEDRKSVV